MALISVTTPITPTVDQDKGLANKHRGYYSLNSIDPQSAPLTIYDNGNPVDQYVTYENGLPVLDDGTVYHPQIDITGPITFALYYDNGSGLELKWLDPDYIPGEVVIKSDVAIVYDTVADFVSDSNLVIGQKVQWNGYYNTNDGGGNSGIVVAAATGTDDGGSFFDLNNGLQVQTLFNVNLIDARKFGAADKSIIADSTTFLQNALNYSSNIAINQGNYVITSSLILNDGHNVSGDGTIEFGGFDAFDCSGSIDQTQDFTVAITTNTDTVNVVDGSVFSIGETVRIVSTINCLSTDAGDFRLGRPTSTQISYFTEFGKIQSISGNILTLLCPTVFDNYPLIPGSTTPTGNQISKAQKINYKTVSISGLKFYRTAHGGDAIYLLYNEDSTVSGCEFDNQIYTGASVYIHQSYQCKAFDNIAKLNAETEIKFGAVNPGAEEYFRFNSFLLIGCHSCEMNSNRSYNGTQNFDVSYTDAPSIRCVFAYNNVSMARINVMTTHNGSYENMLMHNVGTTVGSGVSIRSRRDRFIGNYITGAVGRYTNPATTTDTYGVSTQDGYTQGAIFENNKFINFNWGFLMTDTSNYFASKNFVVRGNDFTSCRMGIELTKTDGVGEFITDQMSGISISNNTFRDIQFTACVYINDPYYHGVDISENKFLDVSYDPGFYAIDTFENCKGFRVCNNVFPEIGRACRFKDITDTVLLGPNTLLNIGNFTQNNIKVNGSRDLTWVWGAGFIGDQGATPTLLERDFEDLTVATTSFDVTSHNTLLLSNSSGGDITIDTLIGGYSGQQLYLSAGTGGAGSSIFLASGGNISFPGGVSDPQQIPTDRAISLIMTSSDGGTWDFVVPPT